MIIFICGPDFLSIILFGMPLEEGATRFAGNGWYYLGRDLDFYIEGSSFFAVDSIWRLMPLKVVLPAIQDLVLIGIFQLFCLSLLTKYFYANNHIINISSKTIDYSFGKSIRFSLEIVLGFGLILLVMPINIYAFWLFGALRNLHEIHIHSDLKLPFISKIPFISETRHHDDHHAKLTGNYSSTFTWMDRIFKSNFKD